MIAVIYVVYVFACLGDTYVKSPINKPLHVTVACLVESYRMVATGLGLGFIYAQTMIYRTAMGALHVCIVRTLLVLHELLCV